jgi:hypothetical protein
VIPLATPPDHQPFDAGHLRPGRQPLLRRRHVRGLGAQRPRGSQAAIGEQPLQLPAPLTVRDVQQLLALAMEDVEGGEVRRPLPGEAGGGPAGGDRAPLERLGRHLLPGPHDQLAVEDQAVGKVRGGARSGKRLCRRLPRRDCTSSGPRAGHGVKTIAR